MWLIAPLSLISALNLPFNPEDFLHRPPVKMKHAKNMQSGRAPWDCPASLGSHWSCVYERMLVSGMSMGGSHIFYVRYPFYCEEMCVGSEVCVCVCV